jgi:uncharacterized protein (DUF952 family)
MTRIYKLLPAADWRSAKEAGIFLGSPVDLADGFIHFSTGPQAPETARRYFRDQPDLLIVGFEAETLGPGLKWEPSRGGDLFPHLYGPLDPAHAVESRTVALDAEGVPILESLA